MNNKDIFYDIFETVQDELGLDWWELFDSENFGIVEERIRKYFGVNDEFDIDGYDDWYNTLCEDL